MASNDSEFNEQETAKRRDEALRRALSTPPAKHAPLGKKPAKKKPAK